ncbi:MAG TPA: SusC/RagA family TonB-linked outer membrane protein [Gemmatimonadaceae bacterium]|nr:SusC/RagA family TonB-linked outer membrane protein [Gemmatimonadaceae bacterium]
MRVTRLFSLLGGGALLFVANDPVGAQAANTGRIEGTVTESRNGTPVSNATVHIAALGIGTQTNDAGAFTMLNVPAGTHVVQARRIGFASMSDTVTVVAGQTVQQNFALGEAVISLDQVVVTGTAIATRAKEVPVSTAVLNAEAFERAPVADAQQAISGRIPSVTVLANSGQPGAGGTIKIRGTNTITQNTDPLIYVDGVRIFNETTRGNWGSRTGTNPLQDINANDIERVEIVKGAAATTLYGTEASGGVIQIFTKRGLAGAPQWDFSATSGYNVSDRWGDPDDPTEAFTQCDNVSEMYGLRLSGSNKGQRLYFQDPTCPSDGNWTDPGLLQQYNLAVRGGSQNVTYFVSGNFGDVDGILPTQNSKDGGFRGNFAFLPLDALQFQLQTSYTRRDTRWVGDGNNAEGFLLNVGRGPFNYMKGGKGEDCANVAADVTCVTNGYVFDQDLLTKTDHFLSGFTVNYTPIPNLSNRFAVGWDIVDIQNVTNLPFGFLTLDDGYFWDENTEHSKLSLDYAGTWQQGLLQNFQSTFSWGGQLFRDRHRWTEIDVQKFAGPGEPTISTGAELTYREEVANAITTAGFFLQEQLAWRDRLFVTAGLRVDGHSAFGDDFGLQKYPKIGAAYVLSDHDFWPSSWFETFKIRAAMGESGKAPGAFDKLRTWSPVTGDENQPGFTPGNVGNPDIGPERTREIEGGFDASFLQGRLGVEFTAYQAKTSDALVPVTLPPSNGFLQSRLSNIGELETSGYEAMLTAAVLRTSNLEWTVRGTYSKLKSKAGDLGEENEVYTGLNSYIKENQEFPTYWGLKILNPNEFADPEVVDTLLGNVNPDQLWGLGTTVSLFNRFTLDALIEHQGGFMVQNYTGYQNARRGAWHPCYGAQEKMIAGDLSGVTAQQRGQCSASDYDIGFWTEPGDFTKLRYVSLTYRLPARFLRANSASITLSGRNLFTWTDYHGGDPEVQDVVDQADLVGFNGQFGRRDYYQIPQSKVFTIALKLSY